MSGWNAVIKIAYSNKKLKAVTVICNGILRIFWTPYFEAKAEFEKECFTKQVN